LSLEEDALGKKGFTPLTAPPQANIQEQVGVGPGATSIRN